MENRMEKMKSIGGLVLNVRGYFEMSNPKLVSKGFMMKNHKRERYSVDYFTSYKPGIFTKTLTRFKDVIQEYPFQFL
jgi:hypothetical protein